MKFSLIACLVFLAIASYGQPTYIGMTSNNNGSGTHTLFGNCLNVSDNAYVNWEVYVDGSQCSGISSSVSNQGSKSRIVLRRSSTTSDPSSVIASAPIYIDGNFDGDAGANDKYWVNLSSYINQPGYYTVEIQATCVDGVYDDQTRTTWTYVYPTPYWNPSDPLNVVGGSDIQLIANYNGMVGAAFLGYFTVGDSYMYRSMVVFNNVYYDLLRFTPGNPPPPTNLNGLFGIPTGGICVNGSTPPTLSLGAETNIFHRFYGGCAADVTGCRTYYRVYKTGTTPPTFTQFNVPFSDNCPGGYNAQTGVMSVFPSGGSCHYLQTQGTDGNNLASCTAAKRYQTSVGASNILPTSFSISDAGEWMIDYYNACDLVNCAGTNSTQTDPTNAPTSFYTAIFNVSLPVGGTSICASVLPLKLISFDISKAGESNRVNLKTSDEQNIIGLVLEKSCDAKNWEEIHQWTPKGGMINEYMTLDNDQQKCQISYYRVRMDGALGVQEYSLIRQIANQGKLHSLNIFPNPISQSRFNISNSGLELKGKIRIYHSTGQEVFAKELLLNPGYNELDTEGLIQSKGIYVLTIEDPKSKIVLYRAKLVKE